jgi:hydroxymethylbilane synthase
MEPIFRIGARGSPLSIAQTQRVQSRLAQAFGEAPERFPIEGFTTTGDRIQDRTLSEVGGKGLFTKELDDALLDKRIDVAVHSLKDLPTFLPDGIVLACIPEREEPFDALIARAGAKTLADLPQGAVLGTASLRRQAQALFARPDLKVIPLRGNVGTRIAKMEAGDVDATLLAVSGLRRLGMDERATNKVDPDIMPPAAGQGALAITARAGDSGVLDALANLQDDNARLEISAERGVLEALDGSCRTPIAAYARARSGVLSLLAETLTPDGKQRWRKVEQLAAPTLASAHDLGIALGEAIKAEAGPLLYKV